MRYAARVPRSNAPGRCRFTPVSRPENSGTNASQANMVRQNGTGPIIENGSNSRKAEKIPSNHGCRSNDAMAVSLPSLFLQLSCYQSLAYFTAGKRYNHGWASYSLTLNGNQLRLRSCLGRNPGRPEPRH